MIIKIKIVIFAYCKICFQGKENFSQIYQYLIFQKRVIAVRKIEDLFIYIIKYLARNIPFFHFYASKVYYNVLRQLYLQKYLISYDIYNLIKVNLINVFISCLKNNCYFLLLLLNLFYETLFSNNLQHYSFYLLIWYLILHYVLDHIGINYSSCFYK